MYKKFTELLEDGFGYFLFLIALIGIGCAIASYVLSPDFDWTLFLIFSPIFVFCGWALWMGLKMYTRTLKEVNKK